MQLAEKADLSIQSLSAIENGLQFARMDTYCRMANILALPLHSLFFAEQHNDDSYEQYRMLLCDCDAQEKRALLSIIGEIKSLIRTAGVIQGRNR
jgi:transcriptional regulator with XRE-family HTH domain